MAVLKVVYGKTARSVLRRAFNMPFTHNKAERSVEASTRLINMKSKYNLKVLLISNNKYGEGLENLCGANYIAEQLYSYFKCIVKNSDEDVILLKDINYTDAINKINVFIENIEDDCIFMFYFCGHGKMSSNNISELVMAIKDTSKNNFDSVGIKFTDITNKVKKENIKKFICVVDSCCSGIINTIMGENDYIFNDSDCEDGKVYISSVKGTQNAYEVEINGTKMPCFSYCFWKSLTEPYNNETFFYSIEEIFNKAKKHLSNLNSSMHPQITRKNSLWNEKIFPSFTDDNDFYDALDVIDWRITSQCDNKCEICYACNDCSKNNDLNEEQVNTLICKLSQIHCKTICISGGEPTLSKNFEKIIRELYQKGFSIFLSTNGHHYMEFRDEIETYIDKLSLPLDGYNSITNMNNGRNNESFDQVRQILEYYKNHDHDFPIKISTVLTRKTNNIEYLSKILNLIKEFNISIWKIYEFIPENRGALNKDRFFSSKEQNKKVKKWINGIKNNYNFKIEFIGRKNRDAAYFIIQPNGDAIIPVDNFNGVVCEKVVGNLLEDDMKEIIKEWKNCVNEENYFSNIKLRKIKQVYFLKPLEKNILCNFITNDRIPSLLDLTNSLMDSSENIEKVINKLYQIRVIKNIIPIVNLNLFGIKTFLANLTFSKYVDYPEGCIEDYLCYNAHIGWVTKCEKNIFRIAIFAQNKMETTEILQEIQKDLDFVVQYDVYDLICSYAIGEKKIFLNSSNGSTIPIHAIKYNSNTQSETMDVKLSYEEFYSLMQLENMRKPLKENVDYKVFFKSKNFFNTSIESLLDRGIIEKLSVILDTRLLGYNWYIVFVNVPNGAIGNFIDFIKTRFNNITHINCLMPQNSQWNIDFEIHTNSFAEVNEVIEKIEKRFSNIITNSQSPLKIIRECKFSFLTHYVSDVIMKNYILKDEKEGEEGE